MAYVRAFSGAINANSTANVLSSTGFDRLLLIRISTVSANTLGLWMGGGTLTAISTGYAMSSGNVYELGPSFYGSTETLVGGAVTSSGWMIIDELRV